MRLFSKVHIVFTCLLFLQGQHICFAQSTWKIHDMSRPHPPVVIPGSTSTQEYIGSPPSDAVVLFNGNDLSAWEKDNGDPVEWKLENGYMEVFAGTGSIQTKQAFGDCQLHVEWTAPISEDKVGQGNGNSGVYLMGKYEIQVLNSYQNETYADGQAAAIYGQYPPSVNSSLPPGQWQSYDIVFMRPRFDESGTLVKPATITLLHNGVLIHHCAELKGPTEWMLHPPYEVHPDKLPIMLQDHGNPVRYRNIWVRNLERYQRTDEDFQPKFETEIQMDMNTLNKYVGKYEISSGFDLIVKKEDKQLCFYIRKQRVSSIFPTSKTIFFSKTVDVKLEFDLKEDGVPSGLTILIGYGKIKAKRLDEVVNK